MTIRNKDFFKFRNKFALDCENVQFWVEYIPLFSKLSRQHFHWMPRHNEGTWKKVILMKNIAKHVGFKWQKTQVSRINIEVMVSKVAKLSHFLLHSKKNFTGLPRNKEKSPGKWPYSRVFHFLLVNSDLLQTLAQNWLF